MGTCICLGCNGYKDCFKGHVLAGQCLPLLVPTRCSSRTTLSAKAISQGTCLQSKSAAAQALASAFRAAQKHSVNLHTADEANTT